MNLNFDELVFLIPPLAALGLFVGAIVAMVIGKPRTRRVWATVLAVEVAGTLWLAYLIQTTGSYPPGAVNWVWALAGSGLLAIALLAIWRPFKPKPRRLAIGAIAAAVAALAGGSLARTAYDNSLLVVGDGGLQLGVESYEPFAPDTLAAPLGAPAALRLTEHLPRIDGATALYPLYASFARATYPERRYDPHGLPGDSAAAAPAGESARSEVICSGTRDAYDLLLAGEVDLVF
ncbi:MAG: hypothetical protein LBD70_00685, partial [Bifidobacteriaceae bacterium]|nr:hypothetical protein [Bifidobacteriaceae bacterium]